MLRSKLGEQKAQESTSNRYALSFTSRNFLQWDMMLQSAGLVQNLETADPRKYSVEGAGNHSANLFHHDAIQKQATQKTHPCLMGWKQPHTKEEWTSLPMISERQRHQRRKRRHSC
jgi:hypothetical protein